MKNINAFTDIFDRLGLSNLSAAEKEAMMVKWNEIMEGRIALKLSGLLSHEDQKKLSEVPEAERVTVTFVGTSGLAAGVLFLLELGVPGPAEFKTRITTG